MPNNKLFPIELESQLLKRKPRYLHKMKMQVVFDELFGKREHNLAASKAYENESLKINFAAKKPSSYWSGIVSYFY
jgi:hypothetical protein